jgi:hypothetical protein
MAAVIEGCFQEIRQAPTEREQWRVSKRRDPKGTCHFPFAEHDFYALTINPFHSSRMKRRG